MGRGTLHRRVVNVATDVAARDVLIAEARAYLQTHGGLARSTWLPALRNVVCAVGVGDLAQRAVPEAKNMGCVLEGRPDDARAVNSGAVLRGMTCLS